MTLDFARLGEKIRARAGVLYPPNKAQEELIRRSKLGRSTVQRLWGGTATGAPKPETCEALERELGWEPGSINDTLGGGEPTLRRQTPDDPSIAGARADGRASADAGTGPGALLPIAVEAAVKTGRALGHDVINFNIGGEPMSVVIMAQTGVYDTEEKRDAVMEQWAAFIRMTDRVRQEGDTSGNSGTTGDE